VRIPRALTAVAATALAAGGITAIQPAHAAPALPGAAAAAEHSLRAAADQPPTIRKDRSGVIRTLTAKPGHALRRPAGIAATASPDAAARGFLRSYGAAFGLRDSGVSLKTVRTDRTAEGDRITRFQQQVGGVPVLGGNVIVATQADGDVIGATSEISAQTDASTATRITKEQAVRRALFTVARGAKVKAQDLRGKAERFMFDPQILGVPGRAGLRPTWQVEVTKPGDPELDKLVLVDGTLGAIALTVDLHAEGRSRLVCDYANSPASTPNEDPTCEPGNAVRTEGGPASTVADVNKAYDYSGATYDFYQSNFGRDSIDGQGMPLRSSVRVCFTGTPCPYPNAFWDGTKMVYGGGFASADDVVAHELTHGVTEHTSNLFYAYQSGAINESLSDIFGEFVDQTYTPAGTKDGAAYDWQIGEDLPPSVGVIRNMANPPQFNDPDKMTSSFYFTLDEDGDGKVEDNGGVHFNSGVGNKAAFLMTAAGTRTFNGVQVTGMGIAKAAQIYYRAQSLLTSGADYADLAATLDSSCQQLAAAGTAGITTAHCGQVRNATTAVEMNKQPTSPAGQAPEAPICPAGSNPNALASDNMENVASGKWALGQPNWFYLDPAQFGGASYAHSGKISLVGETREGDLPGFPDARTKFSSATLSAPITIPTDKPTFLWFAHARQFELFDGKLYDGGRVEYRKNGGAWTDAGSLFTHNGYNGSVDASTGAPAGRYFVSDSHGYMSSRIDLTSLGGSSVELRFSVYGDDVGYSFWAVDDVQVYNCTASKPGPVRSFKAVGDLGAATLSWLQPEISGPTPVTGYQISSTPAVAGLPKVVPATDRSFKVTGLAANTNYTFTITPKSDSGDGTPANLVVKATSVVITPSAFTVVYGRTVTLNGQVNIVGGGVANGGSAKVWGRAKGATTWVVLGTVGVGTTGKFAFTHTPNPSYQYAVHYINGVNLQGFGTGAVNIGVAPQVGISAPSTVRRGTTVTFTGGTNPARRYAPVALQVYSNGAWRTLVSGKTFYAGSYSLKYQINAAVRLSFRVVVTGDASYVNGTSATKVVTAT